MSRDVNLTTAVIRDTAGWDELRPAWESLYASASSASTFLDFAWLRHWWRVFGESDAPGGLRIIAVWQGQRLAAAVPLYVAARRADRSNIRVLRFISTGETEQEETCPEYLDILCLPEARDACVAAVWEVIRALDWDCLEFLDAPADSPFLAAGAAGIQARVFDRGVCPVADLSGGFEVYLGRLSANSRQQARRLLREGERSGASFDLAGPDQADAAFADLVALHQERWQSAGSAGAFSARRFVDFHRSLVAEWVPGGRAVLARLRAAGDVTAVLYGFVTAGKFDFYQAGARRDADGPLRSPGNLAHLLLMQVLADRGVTAYDFLRGTASYKDRLATRENGLAGMRIWRSSPRALAYRTRRFAAGVIRRSSRLMKGSAR